MIERDIDTAISDFFIDPERDDELIYICDYYTPKPNTYESLEQLAKTIEVMFKDLGEDDEIPHVLYPLISIGFRIDRTIETLNAFPIHNSQKILLVAGISEIPKDME